MKKLLITILPILTLLTLSTIVAGEVFAQDPACAPGGTLEQTEFCMNQSNGTNPIIGPDGILTSVVSIISMMVGVAAVIVIVVSGMLFTLSSGDPARANKARNSIIYALVGLVIAIFARTIVVYTLTRFG